MLLATSRVLAARIPGKPILVREGDGFAVTFSPGSSQIYLGFIGVALAKLTRKAQHNCTVFNMQPATQFQCNCM